MKKNHDQDLIMEDLDGGESVRIKTTFVSPFASRNKTKDNGWVQEDGLSKIPSPQPERPKMSYADFLKSKSSGRAFRELEKNNERQDDSKRPTTSRKPLNNSL